MYYVMLKFVNKCKYQIKLHQYARVCPVYSLIVIGKLTGLIVPNILTLLHLNHNVTAVRFNVNANRSLIVCTSAAVRHMARWQLDGSRIVVLVIEVIGNGNTMRTTVPVQHNNRLDVHLAQIEIVLGIPGFRTRMPIDKRLHAETIFGR